MVTEGTIRLAVDIGGSFIKGGIVKDGKIIQVHKVPTCADKGRSETLNSLFALIDALINPSIETICVATAGDVDPEQGVVTYSANIEGWTGLRLKDVLIERYHLPVFVENDAFCHLLAERRNYPDSSNITLLTLGTGVGGASIIDGKLDRDKKTNWGYRVIVPNGLYLEAAKEHGVAEAYLSISRIKTLIEPFPRLNLGNILPFYVEGNKAAMEVMSGYRYHLNILLDLIQDELHPDYIVIGGGLSENRAAITLLIDDRHQNARLAVYGNNAGIIGASYLPDIVINAGEQ